ncbi:UbiA family prenyltransferase [soil metagenome]|jgi:4-hydroxybenzoate polyprenyltransferase|nr:UbiA family prenyltransferase [Deinococcota bacterium]
MSSSELRASGSRLYGFLSLARVSNSPTVASNVLAGAALAGQVQPTGTVLALVIALVFFYTAGMVLNDLCDYATDCRQRPERPLPSGLISRGEALLSVFVLFGVGGALLLYLGVAPFLSGLVLIALIVLYDLWHKRNPLSPVLMAATRAMVYFTAFLAFSTEPTWPLILWSAMLALYIIGLTYIAKLEHRADVTRYWPAVLLFLPAFFAELQPLAPIMFVLPLLFISWVIYSITYVYRPQWRNFGRAVGHLIAGVSLLDVLVLASVGATAGLGLAFIAFLATLFLQRYVKGT